MPIPVSITHPNGLGLEVAMNHTAKDRDKSKIDTAKVVEERIAPHGPQFHEPQLADAQHTQQPAIEVESLDFAYPGLGVYFPCRQRHANAETLA